MCPCDNDKNYDTTGYQCWESGARYPDEKLEAHGLEDEEDDDDDDDEVDGDFKLVDLKKRDYKNRQGYSYIEFLYPQDDGYITTLPHAMFTSVSVYAMADMFCVPALKALARNRFYKAVERHIDSPDFPDVVDQVFRTTAPDDWTLKEICVLFIRATRVGKRWGKDLMAALQPVFCRHEDIVQRMQSLPELEGWYFEEGTLYKHKAEVGEEEVAGGEGTLGSVSLPDRTCPTDEEEA
jgi:hypothetical protein